MNSLQPKRFLIVRTDKIGDVLLALPVMTNIRLAYKDAFIGFLTREYAKKVLEGNPDLNEIIFYDPLDKHKGMKGLFRLVNLIKGYKFDKAIIVFPTFKIALAIFLARVTVRIGVGYRWYSFLFNKRVYFHRSKVEKHELEYNLELLKPLDIPIKDKTIKIWLNEEDKKFVGKFFEENKIDISKPVIGIHPGRSVSALNWSFSNYAKLIDEIYKNFNMQVILLEGRGEEDITCAILKNLSCQPVILRGSTDIRQVTSVISSLSLYISGNTGTMHIAAAVNVPTISFFCPIFVLQPKRWGPWGNKSVILQPEGLSCKKCKYEKCKHYNCMDKISVEMVISKIKEGQPPNPLY
ncbi:MAG: glycosyltransferase family 9 protein [Candidatus Firestonebacteria bacterium]